LFKRLEIFEISTAATCARGGHTEQPRVGCARIVSADAGGGAVGRGPVRDGAHAVVTCARGGVAEEPRDGCARIVSADAGLRVGRGPVRDGAGRGGEGAQASHLVRAGFRAGFRVEYNSTTTTPLSNASVRPVSTMNNIIYLGASWEPPLGRLLTLCLALDPRPHTLIRAAPGRARLKHRETAVLAARVVRGQAEHSRVGRARLVSADAGLRVGRGPVRVRAARGGEGAHARPRRAAK